MRHTNHTLCTIRRIILLIKCYLSFVHVLSLAEYTLTNTSKTIQTRRKTHNLRVAKKTREKIIRPPHKGLAKTTNYIFE